MTSSRDGAIYALLLRRFNRRDVMIAGGALAATSVTGCSDEPAVAVQPAAEAPESVFATIPGSAEDRVVLPPGFVDDVVIRWGDPLVAGARALPVDRLAEGSLFASDAAAIQSQAFGVSCDGMGIIPIDDERMVLCINHETPEMSRMFPGWSESLRERRSVEFVQDNPNMVAVMRASVGASVVEVQREGGRWQRVMNSRLSRRITADTPMQFSGPAARHRWLGGSDAELGSCLGTFGNCAAGSTPWGTYLTAEENTNDFFGNASEAEFEPLLERANERFGMRGQTSLFRWEVVDERFDHTKYPSESMKFGWIVEIDPLNPERPIKKRTALGRFRHEGATTVLDADDHPVVYLGDDSSFEYFYKFVSDRVYDPENPGDTDELLDDGTLYVARCNDDGSGEWLPLVHGQHPELSEANGFSSQADIVLRCREAADLLGATPLDRPEDVAVHPLDGRVYLSCTQGTQRGLEPPAPPAPAGDAAAANANATATGSVGTTDAANQSDVAAEADGDDREEEGPQFPGPDAANPRGPNPYGHILEFTEAGSNASATTFTWDVFLLAGDPATRGLASVAIAGRLAPAVAYYAGRSDSKGMSAFANPDNLGFDPAGNLWIVTDGAQPSANNNGCFVCPTAGAERGLVRQFMSGPVGAEVSGCTFSPDGETLFLSIQHPGGSSPIDAPSSHWPDGGEAHPRSSLIAVRSVDQKSRFFI